jgi:hypothetical protein
MHVGEDGRDGADLAGRPGGPDVRVEMLDEKLIEALVDGKDPSGVWFELLRDGHDCLSSEWLSSEGFTAERDGDFT